MNACSSNCGWCGRCTDGDPREPERELPDYTEADFQAAIRRSEQDSLEMHKRWKAQDALKGVR